MIQRKLGHTDIDISVIALGTWPIGGLMWGGTDRDASIDAIRYALDHGVNAIDTAPIYGYGLAEELIAEAIKDRKREDVIIATKAGLVWDRQDGGFYFEREGKQVYFNLRSSSVRIEVEDSLKRLKTDYIDLYQTHRPDPTTPISETMTELLKLKEEGKIRAIGVSNADIGQMQEYLDLGVIDSNQPCYNMLQRGIEQGDIAFCQEHQISILSYSPFARGVLTGKVTPERKFAEGDTRRSQTYYTPENIVRINKMLEQFAPFREKYSMTQTQLTAAWTISRPGVTCALVGARNQEQVADFLPGGEKTLSSEDLAAIDGIIDKLEIEEGETA